MIKHFFLQLSIVQALLLVVIPMVDAVQFTDTQGTPYQTAFAYLADKQIVQGYNDGSGKPYAPINRAEVLKVLVAAQAKYQDRLTYFQRNVPPIGLFSDVNQMQWYVPFLETAFEAKMVTGYPDGTFKPGNFVTVEEALAMMIRSFELDQSGAYIQSKYIQNADGHWYTPIINSAIRRNLISKKEKLRIGSAMTRGQFFDALYRLESSISKGLLAYEDPTATVVATPVPPRAGGTTPPVTVNPPVNNGTNNGSSSQYLSTKPFAITIPSAGIYDLPIVRPTDYSPDGLLAPLQSGVGHLFSFPGGGGKIMVYGHSSSFPWDTSEFTKIFRKINEVNTGDMIYVTYNNKVYTYKVSLEETIPAADTSRFQDDGTEELILYTCWPPDSIEQRYLVRALPM